MAYTKQQYGKANYEMVEFLYVLIPVCECADYFLKIHYVISDVNGNPTPLPVAIFLLCSKLSRDITSFDVSLHNLVSFIARTMISPSSLGRFRSSIFFLHL